MFVSYCVHWEETGAVKRFFGAVTALEVMQSVVEIEGDARLDDIRYVINDLLAATAFSCDSTEVDEIAAIAKASALSNSRIMIAIVATMPEITTGARQYVESPMNVYQTRIFSTLAEARVWIAEARVV